jgi:magnesium transporter
MDVRIIDSTGAHIRQDLEIPSAAGDLDDSFMWVDLPAGDPETERVLGEVFSFHALAVHDSLRRNPAPKLHVYPEEAFVVLHAPELGDGGHVHYIELDVFLSPRFLVTVHGPLNPAVDPELALVETGAVAARIDSGRWRPATPQDLAHAIVTGLNRRMRHHLERLTTDIWKLERTVTAGHLGNPEQFLEEMFRVQHGLQAVRTMAALNRGVFGRLGFLDVLGPSGLRLTADSVDQFERIRETAEAQADYLEGVITLYQTRTNTKMTVAAERLAVIAAVTLPVTAVSSVLGMNVIVNDHTSFPVLLVVLAVMGTMSLWLLIWSKRQGWW